MIKYKKIKNNETISIDEIPILTYIDFFDLNSSLLRNEANHIVHFFGMEWNSNVRLFSLIADDNSGLIYVFSVVVNSAADYRSLSHDHAAFQIFERDIHERFGIRYPDHPWLKPLRYPHNSFSNLKMKDYPFYQIHGDDIHQVAVGPIHAGIIEPGHFRFLCSGETVLHLEMQFGYQHRGVEGMMVEKKKLPEQVILAESIAGDTTVGHASAFAHLFESLSGMPSDNTRKILRNIALELERIAMHTGDLGAISSDVGYQLGAAVFGRLRTPVINFFQSWCGNRLGRSLIRPGKSGPHFTGSHAAALALLLDDFERDFSAMSKKLFSLPSASSRFERTGELSRSMAIETGAVGMAARASSLRRDVRASHPYSYYIKTGYHPVLLAGGDVESRARLRSSEVNQSIEYIRELLRAGPFNHQRQADLQPALIKKDAFSVSMVEGWRGEIVHAAISDSNGEICCYRIKDPSIHNWMALALVMRNSEISDFPLCNKSFNLSYCGHDL